MRIKVVVTDRPVLAIPIVIGSLEFVVRQPQRDATPGEAAPPHLPALCPEKGLILRCLIGESPFIGVERGILFPVARMLGLQSMPSAEQPLRSAQAVGGLTSQGLLGR